ncbi:hypothetical protein D3C85_1719630 [compost metagenome]
MLDLHAAQLIATKTAPEAQQNQRTVALRTQQTGTIACRSGNDRLLLEPAYHLFQMLKLQRLRLFFLCRVQCANAFEHLAHHGCLGWVGETLAAVPLRQRR